MDSAKNKYKEAEMKNRQRGRHSSIISFLLIVALLVTMIPAIPAEAASKKTKALRAYKKLLSQKTVCVMPRGIKYGSKSGSYKFYKPSKAQKVEFMVAYIDKDDVPELILREPDTGYGIWTYKNGKMVNLDWSGYFSKPYGYYRKKGIFVEKHLTDENPWYEYFSKIPNTVREVFLEIEHYAGKKEAEYYIRGDKVTKSKFEKKLKSYVGSRKLEKVKMYKNTKANRKKYLK